MATRCLYIVESDIQIYLPKIRWFSIEKNYPILLNPVLFWKYSLFKVKVMGLICNLFSNTCKVLKNLRKHFLSIRNHTFLVKYDVTNTPTKYELVVMSIKNLSNKNKLGLYVSLYWCTCSYQDTLGNQLHFWEPRNSKTKAELLYNNLICMRSPDISIT
jgi:hypothetical protein